MDSTQLINRSFVLSGMIDENTSSFPDGEVGNIKYVLEKGEVDDEKYDRLGYPIDIDVFGNEYPCNAGITNESGQRSKHLSSKPQRRMRHKNIEKQVLEKQRSLVLKQQKAASLLAANAECEKKLLSSMKVRLQSEVDVPPESIGELNLPTLTSALCLFSRQCAVLIEKVWMTVVIPQQHNGTGPKRKSLLMPWMVKIAW